MLSMNLGIVNLIPIPALDGGKILINLIELVRRKPLKQETETYITLVGGYYGCSDDCRHLERHP